MHNVYGSLGYCCSRLQIELLNSEIWRNDFAMVWKERKSMARRNCLYLQKNALPDDPVREEFRILSIDSTAVNETLQGWLCGASIVECVLRRYKEAVPRIVEINIRTDNAGCYSNNMLPIVLSYICLPCFSF